MPRQDLRSEMTPAAAAASLGSVALDEVEERGGVYAVQGSLSDKIKHFQSGGAKHREGAEVVRSDSRRQLRKAGGGAAGGAGARPLGRESSLVVGEHVTL